MSFNFTIDTSPDTLGALANLHVVDTFNAVSGATTMAEPELTTGPSADLVAVDYTAMSL